MPDTTFAVLFDMDGVLVDNTDFHINAWIKFAQDKGFPLTRDQYVENINGRVSADAMAYVFKRPIEPGELIVLTEEKEAIYRELYRPYLQPAPGLMAFLDALKAQHVRLAVGTSAPMSNVHFTLDGLLLRSYFDAIVDASMVRHGKPDPEIYLKAAEKVGVEPARCVVFEDAFAGIQAGLRAGMAVVAVATTHTREELADSGASLIIDNFDGLTVDTIRDLVDKAGH
ncbi:HAD family hydrolase [Spirosoma agri]|uniref:Beta-phosphoglucomutase n=1 Tax=Spirosoma agri TaxID=1987381 RepID=A0A6M0II88_9BACT|nr:HAD family phosphatase [Spirosoma agri]NEU67986.1 HAD family phosphatase [Spirosoma agri]